MTGLPQKLIAEFNAISISNPYHDEKDQLLGVLAFPLLSIQISLAAAGTIALAAAAIRAS